VLSTLSHNLAAFSRELRDYADQLEHAQNEHWIQLGLMAALTVLNAAQGGADPATDAAEVAAGAGLEVTAGVSLAGLCELALGGALSGFGSDVLSQFGVDLLDRTDPRFDQTGDDVVPAFDAGEAAGSALNGALSEVEGGLWPSAGDLSYRKRQRFSEAPSVTVNAWRLPSSSSFRPATPERSSRSGWTTMAQPPPPRNQLRGGSQAVT
jgi:uncharacterized membrane protein